MTTLSVSEILDHIDFYHKNYQAILQNTIQYYIPVQDAYIQLPFCAKIPLFLGDILQLWLSQQWSYNEINAYLFNPNNLPFKLDTNSHTSYIYQLNCRGFIKNSAKIYLGQNQQTDLPLYLNQICQYLITYKLLTKPKIVHFNSVKKAI